MRRILRQPAVPVTCFVALALLIGCGSDDVLDPPVVIAEIRLSSDAGDTLAVGDTARLRAEAWGPSGQVPTPPLVWATDDPAVATIDASGRVTATGRGEVRVTATYHGLAGEYDLQVAGVRHAGGLIHASETWLAEDNPHYLMAAVTVQGTEGNCPTLTLLKGVEVRVAPNARLRIGGSGCARIHMHGTATEPVRFAALDGSAEAGSWQGIFVDPGTRSASLGHLVLEHCGDANLVVLHPACLSTTGAPTTDHNATISFQSLSIRASGGLGFHLAPGWSFGEGTGPVLLENVAAGLGMLTVDALPSLPAMEVGADVRRRLHLYGGRVTADQHWGEAPLDYDFVLHGVLDVAGPERPRLHVAAGTELGMATAATLRIGHDAPGDIRLQGEAGRPVRVVSAAAIPTPGAWRHVRLGPYVSDESLVRHAIVEHCGGEATAPLAACLIVGGGGEVLLQELEIRNGSADGLRFTGTGGFAPGSGPLTLRNLGGHPVTLHPTRVPGLPAIAATNNHRNSIRLLGGELTTSYEWTAEHGLPWHLDGSVTLDHRPGEPRPVLTIGEGVHVRNGWISTAGANGPGTLRVLGTEEDPVVFEDIGGILFEGNAQGSSVRHARMRCTDRCIVVRETHDPLLGVHLEDVRIDGAGLYGLEFGPGGRVHPETGEISVGNAVFPVAVGSADDVHAVPLGMYVGNVHNGILVDGGMLTRSRTWGLKVPYIIQRTVTIAGPDAPVLTLPPGARLVLRQLPEEAALIRIGGDEHPGGVHWVGTPKDSVIVTGLEPVPGYHNGIAIMPAALPETRIEYAQIEFGGNRWFYISQPSTVYIGADPGHRFIENSTIRGSDGHGIFLDWPCGQGTNYESANTIFDIAEGFLPIGCWPG